MRSAGHLGSARLASAGTIQSRKFQKVPLSNVATAQHDAGKLKDIARSDLACKSCDTSPTKGIPLSHDNKDTYVISCGQLVLPQLGQKLHKVRLVALDTGVPPTGKTAP